MISHQDYEAALANALAYQNELTLRLVRRDREIKRLLAELDALRGNDVIAQAQAVVAACLDGKE